VSPTDRAREPGAPSPGPASGPVVVEASLDNLGSGDVRFLQEAARSGPVHLRIPSDALVEERTGAPPLFPADERLFLAESVRWVTSAAIVDRHVTAVLPELVAARATLVVREGDGVAAARLAAAAHGIRFRSVTAAETAGFQAIDPGVELAAEAPRVVVTGCYDWLHSGHIRFFMDAAAYGALHVVVGSDRNVALLKGPGHPLQGEELRRYMVGSVRSVYRGMVSSGTGWMDAEPEIAEIQPAFYVVNEDGDQADKRDFCVAHGIEYVVLRRVPHAGLQARSSTALRGF
jgi:cytidyltransferase-like protein